MSAKRKRVQVLYAGGIEFIKPYSSVRASTILTNYLDLQFVADADLTILNHQASIDAHWDLAVRIGETIFQTYDQYDGFVVIHGSDQVIYIANLLTFLFERLGKPVVFTGASTRQPDTEPVLEMVHEMNIRTNLVTAIQLATMDCSGVLLAYGAEIVPAVRALDQRYYSSDCFSTIPSGSGAQHQFTIPLAADFPGRHNLTAKFQSQFSDQVLLLQLLPQSGKTVVIPSGTEAIVIVGGIEQAVPTDLVLPSDIPIVVCSPADLVAAADNIISAKGMIWPAALAKTMVCAANTTTLAEFKKRFKRNVAGEVVKL